MLSAPLRKAARGFTLVELMIAVVIVGILASAALPAFTEFIARGQVRAAAESVLNGLQLARGEAVRRNERVTFNLGAGTGATSWSVVDSAAAVIQSSRASGEGSAVVAVAVTPVGATSIFFNGFGRVARDAAGTANPDGSLTLSRMIFGTASTSLTMQVEIESPGGQIRMCNPGIATAGDPRRCFQ